MSRSTVVSNGGPSGGVIHSLARTRFWKIGAPGISSE
jgi:hypothetical protein